MTPTVKAVVAEAARLRRVAEDAKTKNVYSDLYSPSEDSARKLSQRLGPERALERMAEIAIERRDREQHSERERQQADARHRRRQAETDRQRETERQAMTYGQRVDQVLLAARMLPGASAGGSDSDRIKGGSDASSIPRHGGDTYTAVKAAIEIALEKGERIVERQRRRPTGAEPIDDRLTRLKRLKDVSPRNVAFLDPSQGSPRFIRQQRVQLGLDPETGRHADREETAA